MQLKGVGIAGLGKYVPEKVLTNFDLQKMVNTTDEWIVTRTGIKERRIVDIGISSSDIGLKAAKEAIERAGIHHEKIDCIIVSTSTPDMLFPSTSCLIQGELGAKSAACFDISAACSGFIYALQIGRQFLLTKTYRTVLVVATEVMSAVTDWTDRSTCVLLGDGAGAVVLRPTKEGYGILDAHLLSDGRYAHLLELPAGGSKIPATHQTVDEHLHYMKMEGQQLFKIGIMKMYNTIMHSLHKLSMHPQDIALLIPHQANLRIIEVIAERLNISMEKVFTTINKYGNTSSSSIPIALKEAEEEGRLSNRDIVVLVGFGAGLTWGSVVIRWEKSI